MRLYHIPVCPFSQRLEILLALKGLVAEVEFHVVDITRPRPDWLLARTRGSTSLPVLELADGRILKESLVILRYLEEIRPDPPVRQADPYRRAVENMLVAKEGAFGALGYEYVMNQDPARQPVFRERMLAQYAELDDFLRAYGADEPYLFDRFGWAETIFTPLFMRFWFLGYYEGFDLPDEERYARAREWRDACLAHPAAQQVTREQIIKLYYDYAQGAGNGALPPGRTRSSFVFEPHWRHRPWPPAHKYGAAAGDAELGLLPP